MAGAGSKGFWGSIEAGGGAIMLNLRQVRYARPSGPGSRLYFDSGDCIEVAADFTTLSHRLYEAYDEAGDAGGGDEKKDEGKDEGSSNKDDKNDKDEATA